MFFPPSPKKYFCFNCPKKVYRIVETILLCMNCLKTSLNLKLVPKKNKDGRSQIITMKRLLSTWKLSTICGKRNPSTCAGIYSFQSIMVVYVVEKEIWNGPYCGLNCYFTNSTKIISMEAIHIPSVFSKGSDDEEALFSQSAYRVHRQVQSAPIKSGYPSKIQKERVKMFWKPHINISQ